MSLLEILQLVGYSVGAGLPLWMSVLLARQRSGLSARERVLTALACAIGLWHASNLVITLHGILGLGPEVWTPLLRVADTVAVFSITLSYSFLLHVHLHLWADARDRVLTRFEQARVYMSYIPALFLAVSVPRIWIGPYRPMLEKLSPFVLSFGLWAVYVLALVGATDLMIARASREESERRLMRTLAASFAAIAALLLSVHVFGVGRGTPLETYLVAFANLGSLLPTALIAYYIYRYRYLELVIRESLVAASFAGVVLVVYLYGVRTLEGFLTPRFGLRAGVVEALLILAFASLAAPLKRWLDKRFQKLFAREAALYREVVTRIGAHAGRFKQLPELLAFVEERAAQELGLKCVRIYVRQRDAVSVDDNGARLGHDGGASDRVGWEEQATTDAGEGELGVIERTPLLRERGFDVAYALRREARLVGVMLVKASGDALTPEVSAVLGVLAGQVAIAIEDCRLVEENVKLELRLAQGERLAELGQMAATVAHEVKNPLSAIKSIAQVMREDPKLSVEYARDLELIVGETERLSQSVSQLLNFARYAPPPASAPARAGELASTLAELFRADARARGIRIECGVATNELVDGRQAVAVREALSNLLHNAIQATPSGKSVSVEVSSGVEGLLTYVVVDGGRGVPAEIRGRIWEPFFTTKQRGTGLGLAIVRKRMEELGGTAQLAPQREGEGARFVLTVKQESPRGVNYGNGNSG